ncbi:murein hydrolase activator EnvC family protein [Parvularcula sp. LCG005]|uniref:murein hydrolase activator EnvC family protein n=1 Tax=Parvularcula sp. LCG005 TaxID=3078805 RepID=UPI0029427D7E|nr:peptidoglycan DD-metalloendopeptidase family protein [Parvularcula sp. LCG005]WOI53088.1 peptidoglycan DD-metalloendopeptidase family protein [Parvularcula sp. LCG005]
MGLRRYLVSFMLMAVAALTCASAQEGQTAEEAERLRRIEDQMRQNARDAAALREKTEAAEQALANLKSRIVTIAESLQDAEGRATALEDSLASLSAEEEIASADLKARQTAMSNVLAALQSLERSRPPALAVSPDDATDAAVAAIALSAVTPELQAEAKALREQLDRIADIRARQARERQELDRTESALSERRRLLEDALSQREAAHARDRARLAQIEEEDRKLAQEATTLRDLIAGIAARPSRVVPRPEAPTGGPEIYANLPSRFSAALSALPLPAAGRITSGFGVTQEGGGRSEDITLSTRPGAIVTAPFGGRVVWAAPVGRLGNIVIIDVGDDYRLVLVGLGTLDVTRDDVVRAGEPLGSMDRGGPGALRFQIRRNNVPINPAPWLISSIR